MARPTKIIPRSEGFNRFYAAWRRKQHWPDAMRAWDNLGLDLFADKVVEAAKEQTLCEYSKKKIQFVPLPATWLNACGWEDDLESVLEHRAKKKRQELADRVNEENRIAEDQQRQDEEFKENQIEAFINSFTDTALGRMYRHAVDKYQLPNSFDETPVRDSKMKKSFVYKLHTEQLKEARS